MIVNPAAALQHQSTFNRGGVLQVFDSYSKEEATMLTLSREGAGVQEAEGQTIQPQQTNGTSGQGMEG